MKKDYHMKYYSLFLFIAIFASIVSCENINDADDERFIIKIDSVLINQPIVDKTVEMQIYATIGNNGCFYYSGYQMHERHQVLEVVIYGNKEHAEICSQEMRYLDGETIGHKFMNSGDYLIKIAQPDNTYLTKLVTVE